MAEHAEHQHANSVCYASGCFTAVAPIPLDAPATLLSLLLQLRPDAGHFMVPAEIDPSDPPPRLQA